MLLFFCYTNIIYLNQSSRQKKKMLRKKKKKWQLLT